MAFLTGSSTYIENLLKRALQKENISFKEQYLIYEGGRFSKPKYSADFLVYNGEKEILVECDGRQYHDGKVNLQKLKERDFWLRDNGYTILHFTYDDIRYNIHSVISTIKKEIDLPYNKNTKLLYHPEKLFPFKHINYNKNTEVFLYCYFIQKNGVLYVSYKFKHIKTETWSNERFKCTQNTNPKLSHTKAFYLALQDLKKPVTIKVFYNNNLANKIFDLKNQSVFLLNMLKKDNLDLDSKISFDYIYLTETSKFAKKDPIKTINRLHYKCRQMTYNKNLIPISLK